MQHNVLNIFPYIAYLVTSMARYSLEDITRLEKELVDRIKRDKDYASRLVGDYIATWLPYVAEPLSPLDLHNKKKDIVDIGAIVTGVTTFVGDRITPYILSVCCRIGYAVVTRKRLPRREIRVETIYTYKKPRCSICDNVDIGSAIVAIIVALGGTSKYYEWMGFLHGLRKCVEEHREEAADDSNPRGSAAEGRPSR